MEIKDRFEFINQVFEKHINGIETLIENHSFPKSMLCLYSKVLQIESLRKILEKTDENFYSSQVLLRTLLEHYLVGYYAYYKTSTEKDDSIGEAYYDEYVKSEIIKRENYYFNLDKIKGDLKSENLNGYLSKHGEELIGLTQVEIDNIHKKASQFSNVRSVIKYLFNVENQTKAEGILHTMLFDFLEKYNKLSSYVHGGVSAEVESFNKDDSEKRMEKIEENKTWGISLEANLKFYFLFLLFKDNPDEVLKLNGFLKK